MFVFTCSCDNLSSPCHLQALLSPQSVTLCLQCCQVAPLTDDYTQTSSAVFEALYYVLNEMLLQHAFVVFGCIPAFISAAKHILLCVLINRQRDPIFILFWEACLCNQQQRFILLVLYCFWWISCSSQWYLTKVLEIVTWDTAMVLDLEQCKAEL